MNKEENINLIINRVLNELEEFIRFCAVNKANKEDITWITVRGSHIPIIKSQGNVDEQIKQFFANKSKEGTYENTLQKVRDGKDKKYTFDEILDSVFADDSLEAIKSVSKQEVIKKIKFAEKYNRQAIPTETLYREKNGTYGMTRELLHKEILHEIFADAKKAKPADGEKPKFIMLGGRGGSGKSKFNGMVYDKEHYIVLDADAIKEKIPEYRGYNAFEVHEESSHILKEAIAQAQANGLNVVLDGTMKGLISSEKQLQDFKNKGYNIEMYYMHLPREISTRRAIDRFMDKKGGRYVPIDVLLDMKDNEDNFDKLKTYASKWAFFDNSKAKKGEKPTLLKKSDNFDKKI